MDNLQNVINHIKHVELDLFGYNENNCFKKRFYKENKCLLHKEAMKKLKLANEKFNNDGYNIIVIDAYRPLSVQIEIFKMVNGDTKYVSDPNKSRHPRGTAIDITLKNMKTGEKLPMPSEISDFSEKSHRNYNFEDRNLSEAQLNSLYLEKIMTECGFESYKYEWWHFDLEGWDSGKYEAIDYPI